MGKGNPFYGKRHSKMTKERFKITNSRPHREETKRKISKSLRGSKNHRYGTTLYSIWLRKYGKDKADRLEIQWKRKMSKRSSGSNNPMYGKPSPKGSGNGWSGWYKGWYFRSLLELSYMINVIEKNGWDWETAESKKLTIPYLDYRGEKRTYRADFLVNKINLVEIKPKKLHASPSILTKAKAAILFCNKRGFRYVLTDVEKLTHQEIQELRNTKKIKFLVRYEKRFKA
jgi:hypothetical protein